MLRKERAARKASVLITGIQPSEYDAMTSIEVDEYIRAWNKAHKQK